MDEAMNKIEKLSPDRNALYDASNSKLSLSEGFPFRGFAESEISTTIRSHARNVKYLYRILKCDPSRLEFLIDASSNSASRVNRQADSSSRQFNNNLKNRSDENNKYQMSTYQQHLFNKKYALVKSSDNTEPYLSHSSQTMHQTAHSMKTRDNIKIIADLCRNKIPRPLNNIRYESKRSNTNIYCRDIKSDMSRIAINAMKDNAHSMDVCWNEDSNIFLDVDDLLAEARTRLKTSLSNFLRRVREGISVDLPTFPRIRLYPWTDSSVYFASKNQESEIACKVSGEDLSSSNSKNCLFLKRQTVNADINLEKNCQASDEKSKLRITDTQTKCSSQELDKATKLPLLQPNLDYTIEKKAVTMKYKENETEEFIYRRKAIGPRSNDVNSKSHFKARSMSELVAYKKRYYDTLLSVQRAKVAVTNSLASSSDRLAAYDDPYYTNYGYQRQHLFQQQRQFARPQFSMGCPTTLSGLSSTHDDQYSWARSDCKYLLLKQLRLGQQASPVYSRNQDGWIHPYVGSMYPYPFAVNTSDQMKQSVRRKSLEDIIGKLKGVERSGVNN